MAKTTPRAFWGSVSARETREREMEGGTSYPPSLAARGRNVVSKARREAAQNTPMV